MIPSIDLIKLFVQRTRSLNLCRMFYKTESNLLAAANWLTSLSAAAPENATSATATFSVVSARVRIVTVSAGDTVGSLSARMVGTDRPQELFRLINGLAAGQSVSVGERVKIVTDVSG